MFLSQNTVYIAQLLTWTFEYFKEDVKPEMADFYCRVENITSTYAHLKICRLF